MESACVLALLLFAPHFCPRRGWEEPLLVFSTLGGEQELAAPGRSSRPDRRTHRAAGAQREHMGKRVLLELDQRPEAPHVSLLINYESHCTSCLNY